MSHLYNVVEPITHFVVIFDYDEQIILKAGEEVRCMDYCCGWWVKVQNVRGEQGFVPKTYLARPNSIESMSWFFPGVSRAESIELLQNESPGTYLVRASSIYQQFALSLRTATDIIHYKIHQKHPKGFFIHENLSAQNLQKLLSFYQNDVCGDLELMHVLLKPCPKSPPAIFQLTPQNEAIRSADIILVSEIASGTFGSVSEGYYKQWKIAVKVMKPEYMYLYCKELVPVKELRHKNVVSFYGYCDEKNWLIFEYVDYSLKERLKDDVYNANQLLVIAQQICNGMRFIHTKNFIHRDLAARNILVSRKLEVKIADFGLSRSLGAKTYYRAQPGSLAPLCWTALESLDTERYDKHTDVWSFGVLMYEIYTQARQPYQNISTLPQLVAFLRSGKRLTKPSDMPNCIYAMVLKCWHRNPKKRPSFEELYTFLLKCESV